MPLNTKAIVIGCLIGPLLALAWHWVSTDRTIKDQTVAIDLSEDQINAELPRPSLAPEDVVRLQLQSLKAAAANPEAIIDCYSLASPSNRETTGPLSRFDSLVRSGDYATLIGHRQAILGRPVTVESIVPNQDPAAVILVTVVGQSGQSKAFQFVLERVTTAPYEGCWMTSAVLAVATADGPEHRDSPDQTDANSLDESDGVDD